MKVKTLMAGSLVAVCLSAVLITGCTALATKSPTAAERLVYDVHTNYVNVVTIQTNYAVNVITNILDQVIHVTNRVVAVVTNQQAEYGLTVKPGTTETVTTVGAAANTMYPGIGSMASMGVLALLGAWAWFRGRKSSATSTTLAQEIETLRQFILTLPKGSQYDVAITGWLQTHQVETGVANQVLGILATQVNNEEAKGALLNIQQAIAATTTQYVTTTPITVTPPVVAPVVISAGTVITP